MTISINECRSTSENHRIFAVDLHGKIVTVTVTASASVVRKWISSTLYFRRYFATRLVVGLGVQWTPTGYPGEDAPADTLQLSVGNRCLIYQLAHTDYVPKKLRQFLMNSNHTFVGFWNSSDARKLMHSDHELEMWRDPLDLRYYVETDDGDSLVRASTEEIVEECLGFEGVRLEREISMSDWDDEYLSDDQVLQACLDAHCAFLIGKNCNAWSLSR